MSRKQRQVERAPHLSTDAKLVKLADKICDVRDMLASPLTLTIPAEHASELQRLMNKEGLAPEVLPL
jgi:hypothetical protein